MLWQGCISNAQNVNALCVSLEIKLVSCRTGMGSVAHPALASGPSVPQEFGFFRSCECLNSGEMETVVRISTPVLAAT